MVNSIICDILRIRYSEQTALSLDDGDLNMVEHDFYKLMQLGAYSDISEVKKRYYELALLYHPDKNPKNKDAGEYFKIITQGYNILGDVDKKKVYDDLLRHYNEKKTTNHKSPGNVRNVQERMFKVREKKRQDTITDYLQAENVLSHNKRLLIAVLISISGFLLTFNHWYINYLELDTLYNFAGFMVCYTGCYFIADNVYRRDAYKNALNLHKGRIERRAVRLFLGMFFTLPVIFWMMVTTYAGIQLEYFSDYTTVQNLTPTYPEVYYEYTVNNRRIKRNFYLESKEGALQFRQIRVKYSRINPNISEIVILD